MSMTEILDPVTKPLENVLKLPAEDLSLGFGTGLIVKTIEGVEENLAKGWWKLAMYALGSGATMFLGGMNPDPRVKREAAVIGSFLALDAAKTLIFEWDKVVGGMVEFAEAAKKFDMDAMLKSMVETSTVENIMRAMGLQGKQSTGIARVAEPKDIVVVRQPKAQAKVVEDKPQEVKPPKVKAIV